MNVEKRGRLRAWAPAVALLSLLGACSESPGGTEVRCVSASVLHDGSPVSGVSLRAPALLGSVVEKSATVDDDLTVRLRASNQDVTVDVSGASALSDTLTLSEVSAGYYGADSPLEAQGVSGATYQVVLTSACSSSAP